MVSASAPPSLPAAEAAPVLIRLLADSPEARRFVEDEGLAVERLPFRMGRAHTDPMATNDFVVVDETPYSVSRYHFLIDRVGSELIVRDRGSYLGTLVNGEHIGGKRTKGEAPLVVGENTLVVGGPRSPFRFKVLVPEG